MSEWPQHTSRCRARNDRELILHKVSNAMAIRLGTPYELATVRRIFNIIGLHPVGYYDLSAAGYACHMLPTNRDVLTKEESIPCLHSSSPTRPPRSRGKKLSILPSIATEYIQRRTSQHFEDGRAAKWSSKTIPSMCIHLGSDEDILVAGHSDREF